MSGEKKHYARIPVELARTACGVWTAQAGVLEGEGETMRDAIADIEGQVKTAITESFSDPSFWRDENGGIWVAVQDLFGGGFHAFRVLDGTAQYMESGSGDPDSAYSNAVGLHRLSEKHF